MTDMKVASLDKKREFLSALFWASSGSFLAKLFDLATLIILARLLEPGTFGLIALALLIINTLGILSDLGLGVALIQKKEITEADNNTIFVASPAVNIFFYVLAYLLAAPAGNFFANPEVVLIIKVLSLILILDSLGTVPAALLQKTLQYNKLLFVELTASITYFLVAVGLAYSGAGIWSLVYGQLARYSLQAIALWLAFGWQPDWPFL